MKIKNTLAAVFILLVTFSYSQSNVENKKKKEQKITKPVKDNTDKTVIEARIELIYDKDKKQLRLNKEKEVAKKVKLQRNIELKKDKTYQVIIKGINTATIDSKIDFKPFVLSSKTPEIIKPIFSGITESSEIQNLIETLDQVEKDNPDYDIIEYLKKIYKESLEKYESLIFLKNKSDILYKKSIYVTQNDDAKTKYKEILDEFASNGNEKLEPLNNKISQYQKYISSSKLLFYSYLEKLKLPNSDLLDLYSQLEYLVKETEKIDFRKYSSFIHKSINSNDYTDPVKFSPSKDGIDLDITLVNTYVKDTLLKKPFPIYSSGGLSFDFTTGFFHTNLVEKAYFLRGRVGDSTKTDIVEEKTRDFDVSFGALGHISYKFASSFKGGLSMGASLSPLDAKTRYLIGVSLIFGRKNQIALNGGLSYANLKILSGSVEEDLQGKYVPPSVTSVPTFSKIENSFYFGITYNLTNTKKHSK